MAKKKVGKKKKTKKVKKQTGDRESSKELQMEYFKSDGGKTFFDDKWGFG